MKGYIPTLDGWRAVAILMVIAHHLTSHAVSPNGMHPDAGLLWLSKQLGDRGVDVFFAISGFLITMRLLQEEHDRGGISLRKFYIRRTFRILPPYLFYLAILAVVAEAGYATVFRKEWSGCLLFYRNYMRDPVLAPHGWFTGHFWSLAVEEHFYLGWPLLLVACGTKRARPVVAGLAVAVAAWRFVDESQHFVIGNITRMTHTCLDGLLWGCWAACLMDCEAIRERVRKELTPAIWLVILTLLTVNVIYQPTGHAMLQALLMPWLLLGTVLHPDWQISRMLERQPLRWIGRLSYSLYLWQQLFVIGSQYMVKPFPMGQWQEFPLNVAAAFAMAALSHYLIERPLIAMGSRWAKSTAVARTGVTSDTDLPNSPALLSRDSAIARTLSR